MPSSLTSKSTSERISLRLYDWAWRLLRPLVQLRLHLRGQKSEGYRHFQDERWGRNFPPKFNLQRRFLWLHAVSLGETRAAIPLIKALLARFPDHSLVLTHMTPTGREAGAELVDEHRFPDGEPRIIQCYLPYDSSQAQRNFFQYWRPEIGIIMETEVWPNLCEQASQLQVPLVLCNARLSEKSLVSGLRWRALVRPALRSFRTILAQADNDAQRIVQMIGLAGHSQSGPTIQVVGNLKFESHPSQELIRMGRQWSEGLKSQRASNANQLRGIVLFAVSREGEEKLILDRWRKIDHKELFLVIVPRHPERFEDVRMLAEERGLRTCMRSQIEDPAQLGSLDCMVGDTVGEMPLYYGFSDVAILGGSLLQFGGQNLIEALACECPIIAGPHTFNFAQATADALAAKAIEQFASVDDVFSRAVKLIEEPQTRLQMARAGLEMVTQHQGATARVLASIEQTWSASQRATAGRAPA